MKKTAEERKQEALETYEDTKENILNLLKTIEASIETHDKNCSKYPAGHNWAAVGSLVYVEEQLQIVDDFLNNRNH